MANLYKSVGDESALCLLKKLYVKINLFDKSLWKSIEFCSDFDKTIS